MADPVDGHILLACPECRRGAAIYYNQGIAAQGAIDLEDYRKCPTCGNDMVDTKRDDEGRIIVPEAVTDGSVTRERVS